MSFEPAEDFRFESTVEWPDGDNYDLAVKKAVEEALAELSLRRAYVCHLEAITWHPVDSCQVGFAAAARHATFAAFHKK